MFTLRSKMLMTLPAAAFAIALLFAGAQSAFAQQRTQQRQKRRPPAEQQARRPQSGAQQDSPGAERKGGQQKYSLDQAISERAQLHTIAFNGLAFLTGDFGASTFLPPGKTCDFFGFQYMRDIDAGGTGHNPKFLDRVASNVHHILNDQQRKMFMDLAAEQAPQLSELAFKRFPLIKAFHQNLANLTANSQPANAPQSAQALHHTQTNSTSTSAPQLNKSAVIRYTGDIFAFDGELSYRRAEVFGAVANSLSAEQKAYLAKMKFGDFSTWPDVEGAERFRPPRDPNSDPKTDSKLFGVAYMTYASEFFSWYAGNVEADTYFCPERHGTYFGGFYMKDMPAMGKRDYNISTSVTGDSGEAFLNLLDAKQRPAVTRTVSLQAQALAGAIEARRAISTQLRGFLKGERPDKAKVIALCRKYGECDGEMSYYYASAFAEAARTLTPAQRATMIKLRNLDGYSSAPAYLYSQPLREIPVIPAAGEFFTSPTKSAIQ